MFMNLNIGEHVSSLCNATDCWTIIVGSYSEDIICSLNWDMSAALSRKSGLVSRMIQVHRLDRQLCTTSVYIH